MKKYKWIITLAVIILLTYLMLHFFNNGTSTTSIEKEYEKGIETTEYKKGKDSLTVSDVRFHKADTLKKAPNEKMFTRTDSAEDYDITFNIKPSEDPDSIDLEYFLNIKAQTLIRIDTLLKFRTDTLTIKKTEIKENPIYDTFLFGSAVTSFIVLLITILIN